MKRCVSLLALFVMTASLPVFAQTDLMGIWRPIFRNQDGNGLDGDYAGIPLNAEGRWRAQSFVPDIVDYPDWVCKPHAWHYSLEAGAAQLRIWSDVEPDTQRLVAYNGRFSMREQEAKIWMDGRPHPPDYALHSWSGFSTGEWDGDVLVQTTTHLKESHMRRYQVMWSDEAVARTRWRRFGNFLQATVIIYDPIYLAEPYIRSANFWMNDPNLIVPPYPCEEATETAVPRGTVPHLLPGRPNPMPGQNPEVTDKFGTPYEPRLGGPETMLPEYIKKMKTMPRGKTLVTGGGGE